MRTTVEFEGIDELILTKAVELGLTKSKTSALRMGIFFLNREYKIIKNIESELVERKIMKEKGKMNKKGEKYLSEEKALAKYR